MNVIKTSSTVDKLYSTYYFIFFINKCAILLSAAPKTIRARPCSSALKRWRDSVIKSLQGSRNAAVSSW